MVSLKLLLTCDMCLNKVKDKTNNDTIVLSDLALVILMGVFYQFLPVVRRFL